MSKAYDKVEWDYLEALLIRMGFPEKFYKLIMRCVRSVSFAFLINREVYGKVRPSRGLRQGDPLLPFLFVICAQGFSSLLKVYEERRRITGVPIVPRELNITHLLFADDSILFFKAKREEVVAIKEVIWLYEEASGQLVKMGKSSVTFSPNTRREDVDDVKQMMGLGGGEGINMYLGLPAFSLRHKRLQFGYIKERVEKKIMCWNQMGFSAGGNEVLLKAVIQAIPMYALQCFRLPETICDEIERLTAGFGWGDKEAGRKVYWAKWLAMCRPKDKGGIGFREIRSFNKASIAKQVWRLMIEPESLVAKVFKARYYRNGDLMSAKSGSNSTAATSEEECEILWEAYQQRNPRYAWRLNSVLSWATRSGSGLGQGVIE